MKSVIFFFLSGLMVLSAKDHFEAARAALDAGFPKVALLKIEEAMPMIGNAGAGDEANLLYARALIADGQSEVAVKLLGAVSSNAGLAKEFWLAQAFAANGDSTEALEKYTNCAMTPDFLFFREAVLGRASMLRNLNRLDEAVSVLAVAASWPSAPEKNQALLDLAELHILKGNGAEAQKVLLALRVEDLKDRTKKDFLSAAAMCLLNENESALEILANLKPHDPNMLTSSVVLQAQALSRTGKSAEAESLLEDFIAGHPGILGLERVFVALDGVYAAAPNASSSEMKGCDTSSEIGHLLPCAFGGAAGSNEGSRNLAGGLGCRPRLESAFFRNDSRVGRIACSTRSTHRGAGSPSGAGDVAIYRFSSWDRAGGVGKS